MRKPAVFKSMDHIWAYINRDLSKDGEDDEEWPVEEEAEERSSIAQKYDFKGCKFQFSLTANSLIFIEGETIDFSNCTFESSVYFKLKEIGSSILFDSVTFSDLADFTNVTFKKGASFKECTFERKADFRSARFHEDTSFWNTDFKAVADFWMSNFYRSVSFRSSTFFLDAIFKKCTFDGKSNFHDTVFEGNILFKESIFNRATDFSSVYFRGGTDFSDCTFNKGVDYTRSVFCSRTDIIGVKGDELDLVFYQADFQDTIRLDEVKANSVDFRSTSLEKQLTLNEFFVNEANRETYKIIKDQYLKQNNRVDALNYFKREMNTHLKEINWNKNPLEVIMLVLHYVSNNYGTSWGRGILFLFMSTAVIYFGFLESLKVPPKEIFENQLYYDYYFRFIIPTHKLGFGVDYLEFGRWSTIIDFVGRIFSSYGIYQIVQAFRKYGKQ